MNIVLLASTRRGLRVARALRELAPREHLTVFSFPEEPHEPPFLSAIEEFARSAGADFYVARRIERVRQFWDSTRPDLVLAVNWRYLLPDDICRRPSRGTFIFHDSMLPEYRGFSPTVWAIANGSPSTGVTLLAAAPEVDSGDIVDQQAVHIGPQETIADVFERVTEAYLEVLERNLAALFDGNLTCTPQDHSRATYCCRRTELDDRIDWSQPTHRIWNLIRAVTRPYSGAWTTVEGQRLRIWNARVPDHQRTFVSKAPGRIVGPTEDGVLVLTGDGEICVTSVSLGEGLNNPRAILKDLSMTLT